MSELYVKSHDQHTAEQLALNDINRVLLQFGMSCQQIGLPDIDINNTDTSNNDMETVQNVIPVEKLNAEQQHVVHTFLNEVNEEPQDGSLPSSHMYFLDGPGGSGKTTVYNTLISVLQKHNHKVILIFTPSHVVVHNDMLWIQLNGCINNYGACLDPPLSIVTHSTKVYI